MAKGTATDLVISYTVLGNGKAIGYEAVSETLANGYRVVDVISTASHAGGGSSAAGMVVITVIMSMQGSGQPMYNQRQG